MKNKYIIAFIFFLLSLPICAPIGLYYYWLNKNIKPSPPLFKPHELNTNDLNIKQIIEFKATPYDLPLAIILNQHHRTTISEKILLTVTRSIVHEQHLFKNKGEWHGMNWSLYIYLANNWSRDEIIAKYLILIKSNSSKK